MAEFRIDRLPRTPEELHWVVRALWGVIIPTRVVCPDHVAPMTAFADAYFGTNSLHGETVPSSLSLWHGSRGLSGKSFMLAVLGLTKAFLLGADVNLLGGSLAQSTNIHEHMRASLYSPNAPRYMIEHEGTTMIRLNNRARIHALTASQNTVRGPHPPFLLCVAGGVQVETGRGMLPIEAVCVGDVVRSADPDDRSSNWTGVTVTTNSGVRDTVRVYLDDDAPGAWSALRCTPEHRVWVLGHNWVPAGQLKVGMWVACPEGERIVLRSVRRVRAAPPAVCYDLTTTNGAFFAGGVLVHNCDEIDEMDIKILDAALGQPLPQVNYLGDRVKPYTVMCSTWQNPEGTFTEIMKRAEERAIPVYQWCFRETANPYDGWLTEETIAEKRQSIPAEMWRVEYELGEPSIGNRAFDTESVDRAFSLTDEPVKSKVSKDFEEYTYAEYDRTGTYVACADWGKEQDYTVIAVGRVDVTPHRLVYFMRVNRRPYPQMIGWFNEAIQRYNATAEHDATGLGNVVSDYVIGRARKFIMTGEKRTSMLSEYVSAIENNKWRYPKVKTAYIEHKYAQVGDLYSSSQMYHLPDTVCAFGLMEHLAKRVIRPVTPITVARSDEPSKLQAHFVNNDARAGDVHIVSEHPQEEISLFT